MLAAGDAGKKLKNVFSSLSGGVSVLKDIGGGVSKFAKGFSDADKAADDATGAWGTFGGKMSNLGSTFQTVALKLGILRTATVEGTEAQEGLDVAMELNPIGLIVAGIAVLVIGIIELTKHSKAFRDFWKDTWKDIKKAFDDAFGFIKSHWPLILGILTGPVGLAVVEVVKHWSDIKKGFDSLIGHIKAYWPEIKSVLESPITLFVGWVKGFPHMVMSAVDHLPGLFENLGVSMAEGLWHGILKLGDWILGKIRGFAQTYIINPFKSILGIFSPSKVFYSHGQSIVQGLVLGITDHAGLAATAVTELGRSIASGFHVAAHGGAGSAGAGAGGTMNVTNNITVSGLVGDAGATGRQIATSLNEYLRQTGQKQLVGA